MFIRKKNYQKLIDRLNYLETETVVLTEERNLYRGMWSEQTNAAIIGMTEVFFHKRCSKHTEEKEVPIDAAVDKADSAKLAKEPAKPKASKK